MIVEVTILDCNQALTKRSRGIRQTHQHAVFTVLGKDATNLDRVEPHQVYSSPPRR